MRRWIRDQLGVVRIEDGLREVAQRNQELAVALERERELRAQAVPDPTEANIQVSALVNKDGEIVDPGGSGGFDEHVVFRDEALTTVGAERILRIGDRDLAYEFAVWRNRKANQDDSGGFSSPLGRIGESGVYAWRIDIQTKRNNRWISVDGNWQAKTISGEVGQAQYGSAFLLWQYLADTSVAWSLQGTARFVLSSPTYQWNPGDGNPPAAEPGFAVSSGVDADWFPLSQASRGFGANPILRGEDQICTVIASLKPGSKLYVGWRVWACRPSDHFIIYWKY